MFSGRDEIVRHEQNKDARRQAEAYRLANQFPQRCRTYVVTRVFVWLGNQLVRFGYFLGADHPKPAAIGDENFEFVS